MDFSFKSKLWAENIYHQFESICHNVDGFVNTVDSVKFVENQVQSVGMSVKRLYSNVVHDILPPSVDTVNSERQLAQNCQHLKEQGNTMVQNSEDSSTVEKNVTDDSKQATSVSSHDSEIISGKLDEDISSYEECPTSIEKERRDPNHQEGDEGFSPKFSARDECSTAIEKERRDPNHQEGDEGFSPKFSAREECSTAIEKERRDPNHQEGDEGFSPKFSAREECSTSIEKERRDLNHQEEEEGFSDDTVSLFDASGIAYFSERKLLVVEDPYTDVNGSLSSPPMPVSTHEDDYDTVDSPLSLSEGCSTEDENADLSPCTRSSEDEFSHHYCNEKEEQMAIMPSTFCTSPKSSVAIDSTSADFSEKAENVLHSPSLSDGCTYNISAASSVSATVTSNEVDMDPASQIMESNDNDALRIDKPESVVGSFESRHEEHYENDPPKIVISSSETENTYGLDVPIGDLDLETVELSSNVKHDGRSVISNSNSVLPGSYKKKNFGYYKKLIQGAFTSQKRLSKEYEHLAITYWDIDMESNQHFEPSSLSPFPSTTLDSEETRSENEWELL